MLGSVGFWVDPPGRSGFQNYACSGQALDSRATLDFSWLSFHPGTTRVPNWRCLTYMIFFVFSYLSFFFLNFVFDLEKIKTALHFVISSYLIPNFFIIICFIWDDLFNWFFFLILSPFTFYIFQIWSHFFNWFLLFEMIFKTLFFYI